MRKRSSTSKTFLMTASVRHFGDRLTPTIFIIVAFFILLATSLNSRFENQLRLVFADISAPIIASISAPLENAALSVQSIATWTNLSAQNATLRAENERLQKWYQMALSLKIENESLSSMLNVIKDPERSFITTRVITDPTGPFYRTVLIPAGANDGVTEGHAAIAPNGLVGRVTQTGNRSSRILMATDINSRIPVFVGNQKTRAILAGTNNEMPVLDHLPKDSSIQVGDRIITSGQGGLFAPALPIGVIEEITEFAVKIRLYADLDALDYVQIVDFGLQDLL